MKSVQENLVPRTGNNLLFLKLILLCFVCKEPLVFERYIVI